MISDSVCWKIDTRGQFVSTFSNKNYYDDDCDYGDDYDDYDDYDDIYIMMKCLCVCVCVTCLSPAKPCWP